MLTSMCAMLKVREAFATLAVLWGAAFAEGSRPPDTVERTEAQRAGWITACFAEKNVRRDRPPTPRTSSCRLL